ncbi:MAG: DNA repair protein RecN [Alistipes sp.]|jgi:DNA repair protein RecN|uniref:DNA repair protein RecN n=1 Tax=Alistipes sp. TaxID=1872444 RepID=UPI001D4F3ECF|nr:DNA repair protein RecN [Alistipes sp.]MBS6100485.1 DNA repair protein RecN [Alistipes sp.]HJI20171.1 DNA repair protein RecN [Rikenellaceae bacterium]
MLQRLKVENYALIESLELELDPHLNILTGETGAGKSILLGALALLLGGRSDGSAIKDNSRNCLVEGTFDLSGLELEEFFTRNDLDYEPVTLITRQITPSGKSRAFVNDTPVQLATLKALGTQLIDIHSQHQNLILSSEEFRLRALDTLAGTSDALARYRSLYDRLHALRRELAALRAEAEQGRRDQEWLQYQVEELTSADLHDGEQSALEAELALLENADRIGEALTELRNALDEDERGVLVRLRNAETAFGHLRTSCPAAAEIADRLRPVVLELKDLSATAAAESERIEADPARLQRVGDRLDRIYTLCQKHRAADLAELIAVRDRYAARLGAITEGDEAIRTLETEVAETERQAETAAAELRRARESAAPAFGEAICRTLEQLGMPGATFRIAVCDTQTLTPSGRDRADFLFSANAGLAAAPVERIASGGELSRVMLALKALLAQKTQLPTILFDEIDTGVSGRIADAMGEIIRDLSARMQVVDITHLPQVASKGEAHFVVFKQEGRTRIARLGSDERVAEIAKMLSGSEITEAALAQARILLGRK